MQATKVCQKAAIGLATAAACVGIAATRAAPAAEASEASAMESTLVEVVLALAENKFQQQPKRLPSNFVVSSCPSTYHALQHIMPFNMSSSF